jgi:hypothetical protein
MVVGRNVEKLVRSVLSGLPRAVHSHDLVSLSQFILFRGLNVGRHIQGAPTSFIIARRWDAHFPVIYPAAADKTSRAAVGFSRDDPLCIPRKRRRANNILIAIDQTPFGASRLPRSQPRHDHGPWGVSDVSAAGWINRAWATAAVSPVKIPTPAPIAEAESSSRRRERGGLASRWLLLFPGLTDVRRSAPSSEGLAHTMGVELSFPNAEHRRRERWCGSECRG